MRQDRQSLVESSCTTSGQEIERVYSYNPGAQTGPLLLSYCLIFVPCNIIIITVAFSLCLSCQGCMKGSNKKFLGKTESLPEPVRIKFNNGFTT